VSSRRLVYHPEALAQLNELWGYIAAENSVEVASTYLTAIFDFCDTLAEFPNRGTPRDDLRPGLRTIGFRRRAVIAFAVTDQAVDILGLFYGGRDYETLLATDGQE
jgi:plasmid stabilization system protein ParE